MGNAIKLIKYLILGLIGGIIYYFIEIAFRGYSHWSMAILGGIVFLIIGNINEYFPWTMPLWKQCGISTVIITVLEFLTGCIVNLWLGWNVWHYERFDILGQICLPFMVVWFFLSAVGIILDDICRHFLFGEKFEGYKLI